MQKPTALMVIDAQVNMFDPENPVHNAEGLLGNLKKLVYLARASGTHVIYVQNNGQPGEPDETRTEGWMIHPELSIEDGDLIVQKHENDAFTNPELHSRLQQKGIKKLIIAGLQSEYCIAANVKKAHALGYEVVLVADSHSTYHSKSKSAEDISAAINDELKELVTLWEVQEVNVDVP